MEVSQGDTPRRKLKNVKFYGKSGKVYEHTVYELTGYGRGAHYYLTYYGHHPDALENHIEKWHEKHPETVVWAFEDEKGLHTHPRREKNCKPRQKLPGI